MDWFTAEPHPMGSEKQSKIASEIKQTLKQFGWISKDFIFKVTIPNVDSPQFGGLQNKAFLTKEVTGLNTLGTLK